MKYILLLFTALTVASCNNIKDNPQSANRISGNDLPDEPYDAFMLQRTYPNKIFDIKAYESALKDAVNRDKNVRAKRTAYSWTLEGPGNIGGRFNCLAVNPTHHEIMYAGSANGGVWKTTDDGATWNPIFDSNPCQAIGAITINPSDENEIWVGTGDVNISGTMYTGNGLYKSSDAGQTWTYLGLPDSYVISSIIFNGSNPNEVLVSTMGNSFLKDNNRGIYRTIDGGANFTNTKFVNDSTGIIEMVQDPLDSSIVYASSFTRIRTERKSLYLGTENYIYKSTDFGQTWTTLSGGLPNGVEHERIGLAISKSSPNILFALYSTSDNSMPQLYKTTNSGATWAQINMSTFDNNSYGSYGWYFGKIYVDPNDENRLYIPGVDLQFSVDGGSNWAVRTPPWFMYEVHADGHFIVFNTSDEYIYCTDGGINKTMDGGDTWTDIENIPNNQFYSITENQNNHGEYAGGVQDNGTMFGNQAVINNFTRLYGGDGFTVTYTQNPQLVYAESQYGNIVYDDNHPNGNWNTLNADTGNFNWHTPYIVSPFSDDTVYVGGERVMMITGAPYGSFTNISPVLHDLNSPSRVANISTINQSKLNREILYAGTADGKVWNTLDAGNNWNDITPFQGNSFYVTKVMPSPDDSATAYVTRSGYRANDNTPLIFKTTDNGSNWVNISGDLPALAVNDIELFPGNENLIFIANDAGVYVTTNGGNHWQRVGDNMPYVAVLDIDLNYNDTKLIAGTFGRSIYTIDISYILTGVTESADKIDILIYPNPATDFISIKCSSKISNIIIYDAAGSIVKNSISDVIDVASLSEGTYFLSIVSGKERITKKFLKIN